MAKKLDRIRNLVIVSDIHAGCKMGLCTRKRVPLIDGGYYVPSGLQKKVYSFWEEFWGEAVPRICHGEPFAVCVNGEAIDGVHHRATSPISHNLEDQKALAVTLLRPVVEACEGRFYMTNGTPVHSGESGCDDEAVAKTLGAIPDQTGRHARYVLWIRVGPALVNVMHHIGTTGSQAYESTAVNKELVEAFAEAGRWNNEPPDFVVRSHRHRFIAVTVPTAKGIGAALVSAGWQSKTPFVYKIPGGRQSEPQFGGIIIRHGDEGEVYWRHWVKSIARPRVEVL